ncbi:chemotaxis response regulator protein-glutamate methylesterase [Geobacillus sp. NFOSA3]|uniref:Protein-glutamate methylesterase/protein-glutamine glutaminase n=2 Tax=Anoxybacillaceae TaxID=3120669 RepID=A0A6G9J4M8_9BACL|nr:MULTISPECIES: chemotaxis response regulator protein-glutamate methylesterase [Bacillaceae]NNU92226.1 chemotaxis response regulator protein-glutamate methylesterase [Geobacillus sp. NFOSA3]OQP02072.1 chemotaxis response regulator protein-glutamate methylesterase [Geobacillus sp. 44C]MBB3867873.1 two-component system chemotaxis response regulator CheB [Parageobacillus toebii NBRC 107807]MED4989879.1 chemotaxis response regulator protein-glutamate methylesterase [Parageobacillus toebii]PUF8898
MNKVKVLVVDDSAFMRKFITDLLSENPQIEVVGAARNGKEALKKVSLLNPDVVTLDVEMPIMNGIDALKQIMKEHPLPVVMLSSTTTEGAKNTIIAMQYGAIDFVAKPSGEISLDLYKVKEELINKVLLASRANVRVISKDNASEIIMNPMYDKRAHQRKKIVCIGTSTGGPRALQQVLTRLPENIAAPIMIVQHMPKGFTKSLAQRLDSLSQITVKEAEDGETLQNGTAYIAPGGFHLLVRESNGSLTACVEQSPPRNGHRPSVDVLFESISALTGYEKIAVIMTGMGSDGTAGLKKLKENGNTKVIAEAQETAVVFGMPRAAIQANVVDSIVPLEQIAEMIVKYVEGQGGKGDGHEPIFGSVH